MNNEKQAEFNNIVIEKYNKTKRIDWLPYFYNNCKDILPYKDVIDRVIEQNKLTGIIEYFYLVVNKITIPPKCNHCGEKLFFSKFGKGYGKSCGSKECKAKNTSRRMTDREVSQSTREKLKKANSGKILSDDTKRKISLKKIGKRVSLETRAKMASTWKIKLQDDGLLKSRRELFKKACLASTTEESKRKRIQTNIQRYGVENTYHIDKVKRYSKISQDLFKEIQNIFDTPCYFAENGGEKFIKHNNKIMYPDFVSRNIIIEFFGDIYHANPNIYSENDCPNIYHPEWKSVDIWGKDNERIQIFRDLGYDVYVVWESDYRKNRDNVLSKLKEDICLKK